MTVQKGKQKAKSAKSDKRKNFSGFSLDDALREVSVKKLRPWQLETRAIAPSSCFLWCSIA
jgi:hypothetical protein